MSERRVAINVGAKVEGCDRVGSQAMRCKCSGHLELRRAYHRAWAQRGSETHGRRADYLRGCRCALCSKANVDYISAKRSRLRQSDTHREIAPFVPRDGATLRPSHDITLPSRLAPPADSYWTRLDQGGFSAYCEAQYKSRMSNSKFANVVLE